MFYWNYALEEKNLRFLYKTTSQPRKRTRLVFDKNSRCFFTQTIASCSDVVEDLIRHGHRNTSWHVAGNLHSQPPGAGQDPCNHGRHFSGVLQPTNTRWTVGRREKSAQVARWFVNVEKSVFCRNRKCSVTSFEMRMMRAVNARSRSRAFDQSTWSMSGSNPQQIIWYRPSDYDNTNCGAYPHTTFVNFTHLTPQCVHDIQIQENVMCVILDILRWRALTFARCCCKSIAFARLLYDHERSWSKRNVCERGVTVTSSLTSGQQKPMTARQMLRDVKALERLAFETSSQSKSRRYTNKVFCRTANKLNSYL